MIRFIIHLVSLSYLSPQRTAMCRRSTHPANCTPKPVCSFCASFSIATPNLKILKQREKTKEEKKGLADVYIETPLEQVSWLKIRG